MVSQPRLLSFIKRSLFVCLLTSFTTFPLFAAENYEIGSYRTFSDNSDFHIPLPASDFASADEITIPDSIQDMMNEILNLAMKVEQEGRFIDRLTSLFEVTYPIGISKDIGGQKYTIVLDSDEITPEGAFISAYMSFPIPQTGRQLAFMANRIPLTAEGGLNGVVELALLSNEPIPIGDNSKIIIYGMNSDGPGTKVHFDCAGFVDMVIDAGIEFNPNVFVTENPQTGAQLTTPLTAHFTTTIQSWSDMIVEVSLPPFQLKKLKGFGFEVQQAAFDFSDLNNPTGIVFPQNYTGLEVFSGMPELWQGFYFRQLVLRLPPELNEGERIAVMAQNLIIDDMGLSGTFAAENLLTLEDGSLGGWAFSLDRFELNLVTNSITNAGLNGKIVLPVQKEGESINYEALIDQDGNFLFSASMPEDIEVPMFGANLTIDRSSSFTIARTEDNFQVLATLHGMINLNAPLGNDDGPTEPAKGLSISGLAFQNMMVTNMQPYFRPGTWSVNEIGYSGDGLNGFAISLSEISAHESASGDVGVSFRGMVSFSGEKYCASSRLTIWATREELAGRTRWHYKNTEIHEIYLKVDDEAISITGYFAIYKDDPVYGDGFSASVSARFLSIGLMATAVFGEVNDYKYFYVDAFADLTAIPISVGPVAFYGFGGGAYYHMSYIPSENPFANMEDGSPIRYEPNQSVFLGLKATVALGTSGNPKAFNAIATFEITFNRNMGINTVAFYGEGFFMSDLNIQNPNRNAPVYANTYISYDAPSRTFHGNFRVYVNAANGSIRGINPGNLAGEVVIHADPVDWYIHVGRPASRIGVSMNVLGMSVSCGSYMMMGTQIDDMPLPPQRVLDILEMDPPARPEGGNMSLSGFAFGTQFAISTGELKLLIFYASFDLGIGFDIILADRSQFICSNTGERPGFNGWYAEGQLYAWIEGSIGIRVEIFKKNIEAEIIDLGTAALLEAKLPNPYWMRGTVGGYYSILNGLIKGTCRFQFEVGELCEFVSVTEPGETSPVQGLTVISSLTPEDGREGVDVFAVPQIVFNYKINSPFNISDNVSSQDYYRIVLDEFHVTADNLGNVEGELVWNRDHNVLVLNPHDILPGETHIVLEATVHFEQKVNGTWEEVYVDGERVVESKSSEFITGLAPDYIPESNIEYSYPVADMMNLYRNESSKGYVQLRQGQAYLFEADAEWLQYGRFTPVRGGQPIYVEYQYNSGTKEVEHIIPASLSNNIIYKFELVDIPATYGEAIDQNVTRTTHTQSSAAGDMEITESTAGESLSIEQEKVIYSCYFRTSLYNSLAEKINNVRVRFSNLHFLNNSVILLSGVSNLTEPFDEYEVGSAGENMISMIANESGRWLRDDQIPLIYENYPQASFVEIRRPNISQYGLIPLKAVDFSYYNFEPRLLSEQEKMTGIPEAVNPPLSYFNYNLSQHTYSDYISIKTQLVNEGDQSDPLIRDFILARYPSINPYYLYPVTLTYKLPDGRSGTSANLDIRVVSNL